MYSALCALPATVHSDEWRARLGRPGAPERPNTLFHIDRDAPPVVLPVGPKPPLTPQAPASARASRRRAWPRACGGVHDRLFALRCKSLFSRSRQARRTGCLKVSEGPVSATVARGRTNELVSAGRTPLRAPFRVGAALLRPHPHADTRWTQRAVQITFEL